MYNMFRFFVGVRFLPISSRKVMISMCWNPICHNKSLILSIYIYYLFMINRLKIFSTFSLRIIMMINNFFQFYLPPKVYKFPFPALLSHNYQKMLHFWLSESSSSFKNINVKIASLSWNNLIRNLPSIIWFTTTDSF